MSDNKTNLIIAAITVLGTLCGAVVGAGASLETQKLQAQRDLATQCDATTIKREETIRQKSENYLVAVSDLLAFLQQHNEFEVQKAREKLAEVQKAAFALTAYAGPDLSLKSLAIISAFEAAMLPENIAQAQSSVGKLTEVVAAWHPSFRAELTRLGEERAACRR